MSEKNFLQELNDLKREMEYTKAKYLAGTDVIDLAVDEGFKMCIEHIQDLINHCIEIQLQVMRDDRTKDFYKDK